jgi:hypothetical protein
MVQNKYIRFFYALCLGALFTCNANPAFFRFIACHKKLVDRACFVASCAIPPIAYHYYKSDPDTYAPLDSYLVNSLQQKYQGFNIRKHSDSKSLDGYNDILLVGQDKAKEILDTENIAEVESKIKRFSLLRKKKSKLKEAFTVVAFNGAYWSCYAYCIKKARFSSSKQLIPAYVFAFVLSSLGEDYIRRLNS